MSLEIKNKDTLFLGIFIFFLYSCIFDYLN